jgi:hypothetical protein
MDVLTLSAENQAQDSQALAPSVLRVYRDGRPEQRRLPLNAEKCSIGSSSRCQIQLPASDAKPLQCVVAFEANVATVTRWAAGVLLNGRDFSKATLAAGDRLSVGPWKIEFEISGEPRVAWADPDAATRFPQCTNAIETPSGNTQSDAAPAACIEQASASRLTEFDPPSTSRSPQVGSPAADASTRRLGAACQTFADRVVLELWTASRLARQRAKALIAAVRAARFQTFAAFADLAAMEAELDLARAAYDTQADFREELEAAVATQQQIADQRVLELTEELTSVRTALSRSQGALAARADECERLTDALAATTEQCDALRSSDAQDGKLVSALEASLREQTEQCESLSAMLQATQAELADALAQLRQRTDDWQTTVAEFEACRQERDHFAQQSAQYAELQSRLAEAEDRLARHALDQVDAPTPTQGLSEEQLAASSEEVERLSAALTAAEFARSEAELAQQNQSQLFASQLAEIQRLELERAEELQRALAERDELVRELALRSDVASAGSPPPTAEYDAAEAAPEVEAPTYVEDRDDVALDVSSWGCGLAAPADEAGGADFVAWQQGSDFIRSEPSNEGEFTPSDADAPRHDEPNNTPPELAELSWKVESPDVEEAPAAFESTSFIEKYRHLLDDECESTPPPTVNRMGALLDDEFLSPAKAPTAPPDDSDDALEAYMAGMMQRMRGDSSALPSRTQADQALATGVVPSYHAEPEPPASIDTAPLLDPAEFEAMKLATRKAPLASDLAALREIANNSARTAIATHHQRQHFESAIGKLTIAGTATFTSAYMMSSAPAMNDWMFWAGVVLAGIGIVAAVQVLQIERRRSTSRKFLSAGRRAALEATPAGAQNTEAGTPRSLGPP